MKLCVIPARGGSKRIPGKNIKEFCGKPIIAYSIEAAIESGCFDKVVVSTDDPEIIDVAKKYGADAPFIRPQELSNDVAGTLPVIKHAINWFEQKKLPVSYACCLYATAPFVRKEFLKESYEQLIGSQSDYCFSVTSFSYPIQRAIKITANNRVKMFFPEYYDNRSQELEQSFHDAGQFYWGKSGSFKKMLPFFSPGATPYILPRYLVRDIDTLDDWKEAEFMYEAVQNSKL